MINEPVHFGETLKRLLRERGISVPDFAKAIGRERQHIYKLYKQEVFPLPLTLEICEYLKLPFTVFIKINIDTIRLKELRIGSFDEDCLRTKEQLQAERERTAQMERELELMADNLRTKDKLIAILEKEKKK